MPARLEVNGVRQPHATTTSLVDPTHPAPTAAQMTTNQTEYDANHLLGISRETRDKIYSFISQDIANTRSTKWSSNPTTTYDSLLLTCRQLYYETSNTIFSSHVTQHRTNRLTSLPSNSLTFRNVRSISLEIAPDFEVATLRSIAESLQELQLSLQELRLTFLDSDTHGSLTDCCACGNVLRNKPIMIEANPVPSSAFILRRLIVLRKLIILGQLRVLVVENANTPLVPSMVFHNKPFLKALSICTSPRSVLHSYNVFKLSPAQLRGLLIKVESFPELKVLEMTANSVVPALDMFNGVKSTLEHLSWKVPNSGLQNSRLTNFRLKLTFYEQIGDAIRQLATWNKCLRVLRLCIDLPDHSTASQRRRDAIAAMSGDLREYLPRMAALQHLEIHLTCDLGFFRDELIPALPANLRRLYISDSIIGTEKLIEQAYHKFFTYASFDQDETSTGLPATRNSYVNCDGSAARRYPECRLRFERIKIINISFDASSGLYSELDPTKASCPRLLSCHDDFLESSSGGYNNQNNLVGEGQYRQDDIPLTTGSLGFINYEYEYHGDEVEERNYHDPNYESARISIIKFNGQILDREHNMHLAWTQEGDIFGIEPRQCEQASNQRKETDTYSLHYDIHANIYQSQLRTAREERRATAAMRELQACFSNDERLVEEHWYFGQEAAAQVVFENEPCAQIDDLKYRSRIEDVELPKSYRCTWAAPEYNVPALATWPEPKMPHDWKAKLEVSS